MNKRLLGQKVESLVCKHLETKGYEVLNKNWTCLHGEVDLVFNLNKKIVFVEVKYRSREVLFPEELLPKKKLISQKRAIQFYLLQNKKLNFDWQLDYAYVFKVGRKLYLQYFEQVPLPV